MDFLDELYKGEINPLDNFSMSADYRKASFQQDNHYCQLENSLSTEQKRLLEKLWDCKTDVEYEYGKQMFKTGFSLGLKLAAEAFVDKS